MKRFNLLLVLLAFLLALAACSGDSAPAEPPAPAQEEEAAEEAATEEEAEPAAEEAAEEAVEEEAMASGEVIELEFWHAMGGELGELVDELVARFNESQDEIVVNATFQGSYDDTYNALLAAFDSGAEPNITQNFDLASQTMIDTGRLVPAYELMAADGYDPNTFLPAVRDYYSNENGMVAMAFNSSTPLIYYNADMFEAAGVDAPSPEWTFSDFKATCDALKDQAQFCFTYGQVGWFFEQILANSGGLYFNNDNGRTARPTEAVFNQGQGVEVFTFLTDMIKEGYSPNLGSTWTETDSTFTTGQAAIMIDSTSDVSIIENSDFNVGTAFIPHSDSSDRNGVIIGGAALWLIDSGDDATNAAAWEFMKFMAEADQQVTWHTGSGYFPVRVDLQDNAELNTFWDENPNFRTAIEQLATTNTRLDDGSPNYAVLGGRSGPSPAIRRLIVEAYSRVLDDGASPQEALDEAAAKANEELTNYNAFFGDEGAGAAPEQEEEAMASGEAVELEFWHAMGGELGELVDELVARFNSSQSNIVVNATFQGSYDDTYNALLAAFDSGAEPNITQNFDLASQTMIDTGRLVPAYELMEADGYDPNTFLPAVRDYYSNENGMVAMAFNSSTPLIYYNADMFEAAGVAPPDPEWTFSDFKATCDALEGQAQFCFTYGQVGWFFEQILANSGGMYFNNDNGRTGRPTEATFNQGQGVEVFTFLTDMIKEGYSPNLGSTWTETDSTFTTGQAAIMIDSTSDVSIIENSDFNVGTAFIPHSDSSDRNGVIIGGAALWLIDSGDEATNAAAWEFMKFMAEADQQVTWHTGSGYFPVRVDLQDNAELNTFWDENPNFRTAIEQLATTNTRLDDGSLNYAVLGGRSGPSPAIRRLIVEAYSRVLDDGASPQEALDEAAAKANEELENYNAFFGDEGAGAAPVVEEEEAMASGEAVELEFWHAMGGELGELVDELVARFNSSQGNIVVNATFQGSYDDTYNALLAAFDSGSEPNITQNFDLASQTMIDTGRLVPAYELMAADGYDPNTFLPAVRDYYSNENGMVAMAFNSSTPLIYYNADMFEAAGIDPPDPEWTFSDFKATCDALEGQAQFCFTYGQVGWFFEQILANSGGLYFNNDNGRTARPTEAVFNQGQGVEVFTFLTDMIKEGYSPNLGSTWTETDSTFTTGQAAIMIDSTSDVSIIENSDFNVGTAFIPHSDSSDRNGVIIGGAALWLIDSGDEATNAAAWEFMKFMAEADQQVTWHTGSGYFPVRVDLQDNAELNSFWDENPNFRTAIEQLATTNTTLDDGSPNYAVLGGRSGPSPAIRRLIVEAYSRVLDDGVSPQEALDEAAAKANDELENYNAFFE